jgi:tetratricopeptide (TPR) repeat protein
LSSYWPAAKRKLELGRDTAARGHYEEAERMFLEARAAIADNDGVDSPRWGVATLNLAVCALRREDHALAVRRGLNALRVLTAAGPPASLLPAADAALVLGRAYRAQEDVARAVSCFELAARAAARVPREVRVTSDADAQLAFVLLHAGRIEGAADAALRAWATVEAADSWLAGSETVFARWTIRCLVRANRLMDTLPVWEWLFSHGPDGSEWRNLMEFVGRMGAAGLDQEAVELFERVEGIALKNGGEPA